MRKSALIALVLLGATCVGSVRASVPMATIGAIQHYLEITLDSDCPSETPPSGPQIPIGSPESMSVTSAASTEYIVQGRFGCFCPVIGSCTFWVLEPIGDTFRMLLAGVGAGVVLLHSTSHGHPDLKITIVDSMTSSRTVLYQFDGKEYKETQCTRRNSENGKKSACHRST
jgi:hypothetical protein